MGLEKLDTNTALLVVAAMMAIWILGNWCKKSQRGTVSYLHEGVGASIVGDAGQPYFGDYLSQRQAHHEGFALPGSRMEGMSVTKQLEGETRSSMMQKLGCAARGKPEDDPWTYLYEEAKKGPVEGMRGRREPLSDAKLVSQLAGN